MTEDRDDGQIYSDPSTTTDSGRGILDKHPFQRYDAHQGTI